MRNQTFRTACPSAMFHSLYATRHLRWLWPLLLLATARPGTAGTAFSYQGRLDSGGSLANGWYDFGFQLFDSSGYASSSLLVTNAVPVSNGLFTVTLDFGSAPFNGANLYLQVDVRTNGGSGFVFLSPRQPITSTPYAIRAAMADATVVSLNNTVSNSAAVGGGVNNVASGYLSFIGGGSYNAALETGSFVGGGGNGGVNLARGYNNIASGFISAVVGGFDNTASARGAFVGCGEGNVASGTGAFVGGGSNGGVGGTNNVASGTCSMIPGGLYNAAKGDYSFAAGYAAKALHAGSFVWNDWSTGSDFSSTGINQFLIHANGGVGIGKNNPATALDVNGTVTASVFAGSGSGLASLNAGNISSGTLNDARLSANVALLGRSQNNFSGRIATIASAAYTQGCFGQATVPNAYGGLFQYGSDGNNAAYLGGSGNAAIFYGTTTVNGTFNNNSDRNAKQDFVSVKPAEILEKVAQLPVTEWSYKTDAGTRHIGPMAQDFHAAFDLGTDEHHIAPMDEGGVALAAIQGLNQKVEVGRQKSETSIQKLEAENAELKQQLKELKEMVLNLSVATKGAQ